jgi:hypothetical protein
MSHLYVGDKQTINLFFVNNNKEFVDVSSSYIQVALGNTNTTPNGGSFILNIDSVTSSFAFNASAEDINGVYPSYEIHGRNGTFSVSGSTSLSVNVQSIQPDCIGYIVDTTVGKTFSIKQKPYAYNSVYATTSSVSFQLDLETRELLQAIPSREMDCIFEIQRDNSTILSTIVKVKNQLISPYLANYKNVMLPTLIVPADLVDLENRLSNMTWGGTF